MSSRKRPAARNAQISRRTLLAGAVGGFFAPLALQIRSRSQGPDLQVNVLLQRHPINPHIYGINGYGIDPSLAKEIRLPATRWGGDSTTRYNWKVDASNAGADWFFMAGDGKDNPVPGQSSDEYVQHALSVGASPIITIPIIQYINKVSQWDCSFPVSIFGPQQAVNPYVHPIVNGKQTDAGNGVRPDGSLITLTTDQILRIHIVNTPDFQKTWIRHLVQKFGTAAHGGVPIYQMDNEPFGWSNTHRDVHPNQPTYTEIVERTIPFAKAVKEIDPTAKVLGPGDFGFAAYRGSPEKNPGNLWNVQYYLQALHQASKQAGIRLLDYLDEHYYPTKEDGLPDNDNDPAVQAWRLRATRSLWDPTYVEKDWIGKYFGPIALIPSMKKWVSQFFPGCKISITEYNFGALNTLNGALAQADVLGIFGREGLDLATLWGSPKATDPGAYAFRIYRNYDGKGNAYGDIWVQSVSANQEELAIYGAQRLKDHALTLVIINKTASDLTSQLHLTGFHSKSTAEVYRYSGANLQAIERQSNLTVSNTGFQATYPANSITLIVLHPKE